MLTFYGAKTNGSIPVDIQANSLPPEVNWIDAFDPSATEMAFLAKVLTVRIPTHADLVEIETSSRLSVSGDTFIMSYPATVKDASGYPKGTPIGFIVSKARLTTIRFDHLPSFESLTQTICAHGDLADGGFGATATILEVVIDHIADLLEHIATDTDAISRSIFSSGLESRSRRPHQANQQLRQTLRSVGRHADLVSRVSESLLGLSRIVSFLTTKAHAALPEDVETRLETVGTDTKSLHEFQDHLSNKTQFLLDSLLGIANIEQNNVFRVLTVVSVVGIPPTFFASMYGMNFKNMPEYDWAFGYQYGLTLIVVSALAPAIWFKIKGWW